LDCRRVSCEQSDQRYLKRWSETLRKAGLAADARSLLSVEYHVYNKLKAANVPATKLAAALTAAVTVVNPASGVGSSNLVEFD
jgi:putative ribosome biogenesis GTPase RsgA